jgi:phage terminase large subunit-like protein
LSPSRASAFSGLLNSTRFCLARAATQTLGAACQELDRRLIEKSITIAPNSVLRFCASNVEVKPDEHGNYWPVKHAARGRYAGRAALKIDGISALVTALTEARLHQFNKSASSAESVGEFRLGQAAELVI